MCSASPVSTALVRGTGATRVSAGFGTRSIVTLDTSDALATRPRVAEASESYTSAAVLPTVAVWYPTVSLSLATYRITIGPVP